MSAETQYQNLERVLKRKLDAHLSEVCSESKARLNGLLKLFHHSLVKVLVVQQKKLTITNFDIYLTLPNINVQHHIYSAAGGIQVNSWEVQATLKLLNWVFLQHLPRNCSSRSVPVSSLVFFCGIHSVFLPTSPPTRFSFCKLHKQMQTFWLMPSMKPWTYPRENIKSLFKIL